jgi:hypothetical protein
LKPLSSAGLEDLHTKRGLNLVKIWKNAACEMAVLKDKTTKILNDANVQIGLALTRQQNENFLRVPCNHDVPAREL